MPFPPGRGDAPPPEPITPYFATDPPPPKEPTARQTVLLLLTIVTTTMVGADRYLGYERGFNGAELTEAELASLLTSASFYVHGLWYSLSVLAILGCHEMGHYLACVRYGVNASRPYFIPAPPPLLTGTLGAFIRVRERFPSRVALFDIGIAGPIAGFLVAVPLLFLGMALSKPEPLPADTSNLLNLGEPLLFRAAAALIFGDLPANHTIGMHPMAFAAWFGLIATAMNLFPFGQLDGGHIMYALLGPRSTYVTLLLVPVAVALTYHSWSWLVWTALLLVMLYLVGPRHPATLDDEAPLGTARLWLAVFALVILILSFTPSPIEPFVQ